jgi:phosphohistidine swiveling domain-containing protein
MRAQGVEIMICIHLSSDVDAAQVGGKAANLGRALSLGLRVPPAFVITRDALALFLNETGLVTQVQAMLTDSDLDRRARQRAYENLCSSVFEAAIPKSLAEAVSDLAEEFLRSASVGLVVRSSGVQEDLAKASFAGVYESFLGVSSVDGLWDCVRRCWCASWSPQAVDYARKMGLDLQPDQMAMIVQELVPAESAGVIFTADPLTGNPWRFVLNAAFGLAQGVMDGSAPADRFVLEWDTGAVLEKRIVEKPTALVPGRDGVQKAALPDDRRTTAAISDAMATQISELALQLDRAFDCRVDVEWAVVGQDVYVVQVRPITALPEFFPYEIEGQDAEVTWMPSDPAWYASVREGECLVAPFFRDIWALEKWGRYLVPGDIFPRRVGQERDFNGYRYMTEWAWEGEGYDSDQTVEWLTEHEAGLRRAWLDKKEEILQASRRIAQAQEAARQAADLIPLLLSCRELDSDREAAAWGPPQWMIFTCQWLLEEFFKDILPDFSIGGLLQGLPCYSYERTKAAQALGRSIDEEIVRDALAQKPLDQVIPYLVAHHPESRFLRELEDFCLCFGMRFPAEAACEFGGMAQVLLTIRNGALGQGKDVTSALEGCARDRKIIEEECRTRIRAHDPSLLDRFERILDWAQFWVPVLDDRKWTCVLSMRLVDLIRCTGDALVGEGLLDDPADLLFLTVDDLAQIAEADTVRECRELYLARKREYERNRRLAPPAFLGAPPQADQGDVASPQEPVTGVQPEGSVFRGHGLAPGRVTGLAQKTYAVGDPGFLDSLTGEHILVCSCFTNYDADWLSLLMIARGLVTVQGAQLHHAVQIARECGVPYVNLSEVEWDSIPDGAKIAIDGSVGTVTVLEVDDESDQIA